MEALLELLRSASDEEKISSIKQFNNDNEKSFKFISGDNENNKRELVVALLEFLAETSSPSDSYTILRAIRLLGREPVGLEALQQEKYLRTIVEKSQLGTDFSTVEANESGSEACKCLVNICVQNIKNDELYDMFYESLKLPDLCIDALQREDLPVCFYFPILRFYLHYSGRHEKTQELTRTRNLLIDLFRIIEKFSELYEDVEARLALLDALSLIFIFSQHLGPLEGQQEPTKDELDGFKKIIPLLQQFLALSKEDPNTQTIVSNSIKVMINVPAACTDDFEHEQTLRDLLDFLVMKLRKSEEDINPADLTPVLLILTSISKAISASRAIIKDTLLPGWREFEPTNNMVDPPEQLQDITTLGYKLLYCMTCSNPGLYHYSSELLFSVCNEDADEFVRVVGIGKGAGILANRGLLASFASKINRPTIPQNVTEEDVKQWNSLMERLEKHNKGQ